MDFVVRHEDEHFVDAIAHWCDARVNVSDQVFVTTKIALERGNVDFRSEEGENNGNLR